jgi:dienelactone hydrolase
VSATPAAVPVDVTVVDVTLPVPGQDPVRAWLVEGDDTGRPRSAVLWLHWLGHLHNDRGEFLPLAVELASRGVVSLLPAGHFPWVLDPDGTAEDVARVRAQVDAHETALDHLVAQPGVDPDRVALVGHDYGGMYGALLAERDDRISALAVQASDATWGDWFATYWLQLEGPARAGYAARFAGLDPVEHVGRLGERVLFQWAGKDTFVSEETRAAYAAANPRARTHFYENAEHQLGDRAAVDLTAFLAEQLDLDPMAEN